MTLAVARPRLEPARVGYSDAMNDVDNSAERSIRTRQTIRIVVWIVALAVIVVLAVANTDEVTLDWLFGDASVSLWLVIVGSAVIGAVIGYVSRWRRD